MVIDFAVFFAPPSSDGPELTYPPPGGYGWVGWRS